MQTQTDELFRLVAEINLMERNVIQKFSKWKNEDGTKEGLFKAFPYLKELDKKEHN